MSGGIVALLLAAPAAALAGRLPQGFVYLRDIDPGIAQEMRYAGPDNFTGAPVPGYDAAECVLRREVAVALSKVQADLAAQNLGLKVYDCYRPTRAVSAFARWARTPEASGAPTRRFYPKLDKRTLFSGYIAAHSAHSEGIAVDLTLVPLGAPESPVRSRASGNPEPHIRTSQASPGSPPSRGRTEKESDAPPVAPYDPHARYAPCTAPAAEREPDNSLDMGTGFDCLDAKAHTASAAITPDQARRRRVLVAAMRRRGFHNYFREWWHFSYGPRREARDFPIEAR